ncbi:MAG: helix-turn-helix domain-containing protein [Victivallales bacterium]|nr:helix-turn-helix domain-containing protein [Victivallales bacterium]
MQISTQTQKAVTPIVRGMAQAGTLPRSEANSVISLLKKASESTNAEKAKPKAAMLTSKEAAERLGVCTRTVLNMRIQGKIRGKFLTGHKRSLRFPETEIEQFLNAEA